jgi:peroxin-1
MPNAEDRRDILRACSRKIAMSPDVDLDDYVRKTEGYSGADLQALLYNAHLACVHSNISDPQKSTEGPDTEDMDGQDIEYIALGSSRSLTNGVNGTLVKSKAEKAQMTKRVSSSFACCCIFGEY